MKSSQIIIPNVEVQYINIIPVYSNKFLVEDQSLCFWSIIRFETWNSVMITLEIEEEKKI